MVRETRRPSGWRPFLDAVLVALLVAMFARTFVVQAFRIPTASMEPNLLAGDHIVVDKTAFAPALWDWERRILGTRAPAHGEVVVFRSPTDPGQDFLKRVVALAGQRVEIRDKELAVDGRPTPAAWAHFRDPRVYPDTPFLDLAYRRRDQLSPLTVPPGAVFVLGDNRDQSWDSRYWGPIPRDRLVGPALWVYASIEPVASPATRSWWRRIRWRRTGSIVR
jgi:signal peptidase I